MTLVPTAASDDRPAWLEARRRGVTATDVAKIGGGGGAATLRRILADKRGELATWRGNDSTRHGTAREPHIAAWVEQQSRAGRFGSGALIPSNGLYAHPEYSRHLATPDGVSEDWDFFRELVEIKTTVDEWKTIPRSYLRQVWWQQHVCGAERTLVVWERRDAQFRPLDLEPQWRWVKRDQREIDQLIIAADRLLELMAETPLADPVMDALITAYLDQQHRVDQAQEILDAFEKRIREQLGDTPTTVMGSRGDLTFSHTTSRRFSMSAFQADHPMQYELYKRPAAGTRLTITPVKLPALKAEEAAA